MGDDEAANAQTPNVDPYVNIIRINHGLCWSCGEPTEDNGGGWQHCHACTRTIRVDIERVTLDIARVVERIPLPADIRGKTLTEDEISGRTFILDDGSEIPLVTADGLVTVPPNAIQMEVAWS